MTSPAEPTVEAVDGAPPPPRRGVSFRDAGPPIALVVIFAVFAALSSDFRTIGNVQNIMDAAAVLAVVTCGITFVLMMGSIDLSAPGRHGGVRDRGLPPGRQQPQRQRPRAARGPVAVLLPPPSAA